MFEKIGTVRCGTMTILSDARWTSPHARDQRRGVTAPNSEGWLRPRFRVVTAPGKCGSVKGDRQSGAFKCTNKMQLVIIVRFCLDFRAVCFYYRFGFGSIHDITCRLYV